jgi:subtilisin-like proprotein convertase family protein
MSDTQCVGRRMGVLMFSLLLSGPIVAATYPIKVSSSNPRLLVDQSNIPFLLIADAPHSLIVNLNDADAALYLADRGTNGFNSLWVELLCDSYTFGPSDGSMLDGTTPFTGALAGGDWDLTTPNEDYFTHVDKIIRMAGTNGLQILLTPLETGGLTDTALANGTDRCRQFGQYLGNRYKDFDNIIWQNGNDFQTWSTPTNDAVVSAIALGIQDRDTNHIHTVQLNFPVSASLDDTNWWPIISLDSAYTYYPTYDEVLTEYQRTNRIPVWMIETHYEFEGIQGELGTPAVLRRQTYWTLTSGAIGYGYGSGYTDSFMNGWNTAGNLDTVGVRELNYATALFRSREWYNFVPDPNHTILTAGYGTYYTGGYVSDDDYATCTREARGHTVIVYAPTQRAMTIDMTKISGASAQAWWFNPQTGVATNFASYATTGTQDFTPPNTNDWVLVLDAAAQNFPAPGAAPLIYLLQITINSLPNAQTGVLYSVQFTAIGGTTPYNWSLAPASGPLPDGMNLSQNGVLSGTPTSSGTFDFIAHVVDAGVMTAEQPLTLTVNDFNTPPTITGIADQTIDEDTATGALSFAVGDAESAAGSLTLSKGSSNPALVPTNNIVFGGSGSNRTVTVTPAADQNGVATITVGVSDGQMSTNTSFVVTVNAVNDPPTITGLADQAIIVNGTAGPLSFTIGDVDTAVGSLTLSANSSNPTLVPTNNIVFGGSGSSWTVTVSPAANQNGTATITVTVSDGSKNTSTHFVLTVSSSITTTTSFTDATAITIPDQGAGTPYPSTINVSGMGGTITNVTVNLNSLTHTFKSDLEILLVSPGGQKVMLMSHAGAAYTASRSVTLTFSDAATAYLPASTAISSGTYKPTDYPPADTFPSPAPARPYGTNLSGFNGQSANGVWSLYVFDDGPGDQGSMDGGWSLTVTTVATLQIPVITWTNSAAITYGAALGGSQLNATANVPGTFAYSPAAGTVLNASNAQNLTVTFTPSDTQNYTLGKRTVLIDVQKAPLSVVAEDATRVYGQTNPVFTGTLTGLQNGDNITASNSSPATTASPAGSYDIVPTLIDPGGKLVNYAVTITNGVLTIVDAPRLLSISKSPEGTFVIQCQVHAGRTYRFQYKNSLLDTNWTALGGDQTAVASRVAITNNGDASLQRFYRLLDVTAP